jgi:hypothetical protein
MLTMIQIDDRLRTNRQREIALFVVSALFSPFILVKSGALQRPGGVSARISAACSMVSMYALQYTTMFADRVDQVQRHRK